MSTPLEPVEEMRYALEQIHNPYHRAMVCAWLHGLEILERMEVMLATIATQLEDDDDLYDFTPESDE